jgi:hypothetical protein
MTTYVVSSDSESDVRPLGHGRKPAGNAGSDGASNHEAPVQAGAAGTNEDPDWVKDFTPAKPATRRTSGRAHSGILARSLGKADGSHDNLDFSDDSVLDLLDDDADEMNVAPSASVAEVNDAQADDDGEGPSNVEGAVAEPAKCSSTQRRGPVKNSMPLVVAPKLDDGLVLVQAQSTALDLSGDVGAVGRVLVGKDGLSLDVKGTLYSCDLQDTNTVCVVTVGDDEAKITATFDEVITLHEDNNKFGAGEQLLSGALEEELGDDDDDEPAKLKAKSKPTGKVLKTRTKPKARKTKPRSKAKPKSKAKAT